MTNKIENLIDNVIRTEPYLTKAKEYLLEKHSLLFISLDMGGTYGKYDNCVIAVVLEAASMGFDLSALQKTITTHSLGLRMVVLQYILEALSNMSRCRENHTPLFANFPHDVPEDDEYQLARYTSILQSLLGGNTASIELECGCYVARNAFDLSTFGACPVCQHRMGDLMHNGKCRLPLIDIRNLTKIHIDDHKFSKTQCIIKNLLYSTRPLDAEDMAIIPSMLVMYDNLINPQDTSIDINRIVIREIAALVHAHTIQHHDIVLEYKFNVTDILRVAVGLNGGDVTLATKSKFKLSNRERRIIRTLFDGMEMESVCDMRKASRVGMFKALGYCLHTGKYEKQNPRCYELFNILRNDPMSIRSFESLTEEYFQYVTYESRIKLTDHLKQRPGAYARSLIRMLTTYKLLANNTLGILDTFRTIMHKVSTPVLLQLGATVKEASVNNEFNITIPAGAVAKPHVRKNPMYRCFNDDSVRSRLDGLIKVALFHRFTKLPELGKVYVDKDVLKNYILPFSMHSSSKSKLQVSRGSRQVLSKYTDEDYLRLFLYWEDKSDLDLSVYFLDSNYGAVSTVSYMCMSAKYNTSDGRQCTYAQHSGDIQNGHPSGCEYIDVMLNKVPDNVRYVLMDVVAYAGTQFEEYVAYCGYMIRSSDTGEVFEPTTVEDKWDLSAGKKSIPVCFDLKTKTVTKIDLGVVGEPRGENVDNAGTTSHMLAKEIMKYVDTKPTYFDLLNLHIQARNAIVVDTKEEADFIMDETFCQDINGFLGEDWLA